MVTILVCCARALSGHASAPPITPRTSRRRMRTLIVQKQDLFGLAECFGSIAADMSKATCGVPERSFLAS
jgi:hypothetical protein